MREILFRGKREDNGEWIVGNLFVPDKENTPTQICIGTNVVRITYDILPETVGQYTGLTDRNGKKIFEGDIVLFEDESPSNYEYHDCTEMRCGAIEYGDNCFYITDRIAVEMEDLIYDGKLDVEIVGNIHDASKKCLRSD